MGWLAEAVHGVVFVDPSTGGPDALQPWLRLFNAPPQNYSSSQPGAPPSATAMGRINELQVTITSQVGRLEVGLTSPTASGDQIAGFEDIEGALNSLNAYVAQLLATRAPNRLAVVLNLVRPAVDPVESARLFREDTKLDGNLPGSVSDLQFGLNVKKDFVGLGVPQNRLCRWGTGVQQMYMMQVTVGSAEPSMSVVELFAETLTVDVNTGPFDATRVRTHKRDFQASEGMIQRLR